MSGAYWSSGSPQSTAQLKQAALVSVVQFLIEQATTQQSASTATSVSSSSPASLALLSSLQRRLSSSELDGLDLGELEDVATSIITHRLVSVHTLNALSLLHFLRVAHRQEGESWATEAEAADGGA